MGTSLGRGRATTPQWDLAEANCIVIQGSDMAECHPVAYRFVMQAKSKGATIVHIDPRFTRTSAMSDVHAPVRPGTDIAFVGGLIRYVLEHERYMRDYVVHYTNAPCILREDFVDAEDLDGIFSGLDRERRRYDAASRANATETAPSARSAIGAGAGESFTVQAGPPFGTRSPLVPTLELPRCVFQVLKRDFARYTPEMV
ncbi:MAG: molybdopterin-dependent oxidoreductase, partial [Chloroflexi bacterium]|nr:molybdopterin-dependent oxidoreductase [Chloroflexota bacterium]